MTVWVVVTPIVEPWELHAMATIRNQPQKRQTRKGEILDFIENTLQSRLCSRFNSACEVDR